MDLIKRSSDRYIKYKKENLFKKYEINNFEYNKFFILGFGRSGTQQLAHVLNLDKNTHVEHEKFITTIDQYGYIQALHEDYKKYSMKFILDNKSKFIKNVRNKELNKFCNNNNIKNYGETNSWLRLHTKELKDTYPDANFIHLVRNPKDVIRSTLSRNSWLLDYIKETFKENIAEKIGDYPKNNFEVMCWWWAEDNEKIMSNISTFITFDDVISNYDIVSEKILIPFNLNISSDIWEKEMLNKRNITQEYKFPKYDDWEFSMRSFFWKLNDRYMARFGFK